MGTIFSSTAQDVLKTNARHLFIKARKTILGLNANIKDIIGYLPPDLTINMFDKQIRSILEYTSEIWYT